MGKIFIVSLLIQCISLFGQELPAENWLELKKQLNNRSEISLEIVEAFSKSKLIDSTDLQNTIKSSLALKNTLQSQIFDKSQIDLVHQKNKELTSNLTRILVYSELDQKLTADQDVQFLLDQLLLLEQQICVYTRRYNQSLKKSKFKNLHFDLSCESEPPKVKLN